MWNAPCVQDAMVARQAFSCAKRARDGRLRHFSTCATSSHREDECVIRGTTPSSTSLRICEGREPGRIAFVVVVVLEDGSKVSKSYMEVKVLIRTVRMEMSMHFSPCFGPRSSIRRF